MRRRPVAGVDYAAGLPFLKSAQFFSAEVWWDCRRLSICIPRGLAVEVQRNDRERLDEHGRIIRPDNDDPAFADGDESRMRNGDSAPVRQACVERLKRLPVQRFANTFPVHSPIRFRSTDHLSRSEQRHCSPLRRARQLEESRRAETSEGISAAPNNSSTRLSIYSSGPPRIWAVFAWRPWACAGGGRRTAIVHRSSTDLRRLRQDWANSSGVISRRKVRPRVARIRAFGWL